MWHIHLQMSQIPSQLFNYCGNNFSFIKGSKGLANCLKEQKVAPDETLTSFDVSALFTSIPAPVALEVVTRNLTQHIHQTGTEHFLENTCFISRESYFLFGTSTQQICLHF